jgi:hypothetical protein
MDLWNRLDRVPQRLLPTGANLAESRIAGIETAIAFHREVVVAIHEQIDRSGPDGVEDVEVGAALGGLSDAEGKIVKRPAGVAAFEPRVIPHGDREGRAFVEVVFQGKE